MKLQFLSADYVITLHAKLIRRWGGHEGGGHRGAEYEGVEAAVQAVKNSYYDSVEELAAAYAVYIVQGHVFMDGNKRAGGAAMMIFLDKNGRKTNISPRALANAMLELQVRAETGQRTDHLIGWLANLISTKN